MNDSLHNSNESLGDLERRLTQATAVKLPAGIAMDGETAEFRQAWKSFGELLKAEEATFQPDRLLAALRSQNAADKKLATETAVDRKVARRLAEPENRLTPQRSPWPWQIVTLLALVVAVGGIWYSMASSQPAPRQTVKDPGVKEPIPASPSVKPEVPSVAVNPGDDDPEALYYLGWDDEEIASAIDTVAARLQAAAEPSSTAYQETDWLQDRFDQFQQDLSDETL